MTDETYSFVKDIKERKQMAHGAYRKVRGKRKKVTLPSDHLTQKQIKEMNGAVATYTMDKPHTYYELLAFPKDLRKEYIQGVISKYHPSINEMTKMLHCKRDTFLALLKQMEVDMPRTYRNPTQKLEWRKFMGENIEVPEAVETKEVQTPAPIPYTPAPIIGKIDQMTIHVIGKPLAVGQGIPALLDPNKNYYFSINISEVEEKEMEGKEEDESDCSRAG